MIDKNLIKQVANKIDNLIDFKKITGKQVLGTILEFVDDIIFTRGLIYLNEKYSDRIPKRFVDDIEKVFSAFVNDDYQGILDIVPENIDNFIDIKAFDDDFEATWITINFQAIVKLIKFYAEKGLKKNE